MVIAQGDVCLAELFEPTEAGLGFGNARLHYMSILSIYSDMHKTVHLFLVQVPRPRKAFLALISFYSSSSTPAKHSINQTLLIRYSPIIP